MFSGRAIAYLKAALPQVGTPSVTLSHADSPVVRTLTNGLCICYIVDKGNSFQYVQNRHLAEDNISVEQLHSIGLDNLTKEAGKGKLRVQPYGNIFAVLMGGNFEASLIILDDLWDKHFRQFVKGDYAVAIPNRDILSFCDMASEAGIRELCQLISRSHTTGDHPISDSIYCRYKNKWIRA